MMVIMVTETPEANVKKYFHMLGIPKNGMRAVIIPIVTSALYFFIYLVYHHDKFTSYFIFIFNKILQNFFWIT